MNLSGLFGQIFDVYSSLKSVMLISMIQEQFPYYHNLRSISLIIMEMTVTTRREQRNITVPFSNF